jgi:hypothetical protein
MNKKSNTICLLLLVLFAFLFYACRGSPSSPEIKKRASIIITVEPDPILMHWHPDLYYGTFSCVVTISEKNGVGVNISTITFGFSWEEKVWGEWILGERRLDPFGTFTLTPGGSTIREVDQIVITVEGEDDNGNKVERKEAFEVEWD